MTDRRARAWWSGAVAFGVAWTVVSLGHGVGRALLRGAVALLVGLLLAGAMEARRRRNLARAGADTRYLAGRRVPTCRADVRAVTGRDRPPPSGSHPAR